MPTLRSVTAPVQLPAPAAAPSARPSYNPWAIASFSFGLSTLIGSWCLGGVVAVITGHVARHQIRRTGEAGGSLALAGIIVGYVSIGLTFAFVALYLALIVFVIVFAASHPPPSPSPSP